MYIERKDHVSRHVPYKKLLRDDEDNPVGILPQAFEMREEKNEKNLSVNWLEYFGGSHADNIVNVIIGFRLSRDNKVGPNSAFGIGNVGTLEDVCAKHLYTKVRVLYNGKKSLSNNKSHASIVRLPINNLSVMQSLATYVFTKLVPNKKIPS